MSIPVSPVGGDKTHIEGKHGTTVPMRSLADLIAAPGLATDDPDEGSGPLPSARRAVCSA